MAKYLKKAKKRLDARIADYEQTLQKLGKNVNTDAFTKPGSMKLSR